MTGQPYTTKPDRPVKTDPLTNATAQSTYEDMGLSIDDLFAWSDVLNHLAFSPHQIEPGAIRVIAGAIKTVCHGIDAERDMLGRLALGMTMEEQLAAHRSSERAMPREFAR